MGRVLITSASTRVAYCICKNLSSFGVECVMADSDPIAMSFWSRHAAARHVYASPFQDASRFIADILRIVERERIDVLIPVLEETYFVAKYQHEISPHVKLFMAEYRDLIALHDKSSVLETARRLGVRTPRTEELSSVLELHGNDFRFPVVLKPKQGGGGWSVREVSSFKELRRVVQEMNLLPERYLVQDKIEGPVAGVAMLYRDGKMIASDSYWTLQAYPHPYGQPTVRLSRNFPDALAGLQSILDDRRWSGPCQADFLHDESRGESFLIDVNPRFWGSVGQSIARGINFPYYYYQCAVGDCDITVPIDPPIVATRWLAGDLIRKINCSFGNDVSLRKNQLALKKFDATDDFDFTDPFPFVGWFVDQSYKSLKSVFGIKPGRSALDGVWK